MIAVDTSALMAVVQNEPDADACMAALESDTELLISAVTVAEALIVADARNASVAMRRLLDSLGFEVVPATLLTAQRVGEIYRQWGKGRHAARLNIVDCFAYDTAKSHACPLLFVGDDFRQTDVHSVLQP